MENEDLTNLLKQAHHVYDGDLFKVSQDQGIAVSTGTYLMPISEKTPRNAKIQLLGRGGVLVYGMWDGKSDFWTDWAPLPRRRSE